MKTELMPNGFLRSVRQYPSSGAGVTTPTMIAVVLITHGSGLEFASPWVIAVPSAMIRMR